MRPTPCRPSAESHYAVFSPTITRRYLDLEPPETFVCWSFYLAKTKREAIRQAVKDPEFREWVDEQRANREPRSKDSPRSSIAAPTVSAGPASHPRHRAAAMNVTQRSSAHDPLHLRMDLPARPVALPTQGWTPWSSLAEEGAMTGTWRDLADSELRAKLAQKGITPPLAAAAVRRRESPLVIEALDELFGVEPTVGIW